jgi:hypothetical protein
MNRMLLIVTAAAGLFAIAPAPDVSAGSILPGIESARRRDTTISKHYVEVDNGIWMAVKGSRERRQVRFARLIETWSLDQQKVAQKLGFPMYRYREDYAGVTTEIWSYPGADREYVFSVPAGRLVDKRVR